MIQPEKNQPKTMQSKTMQSKTAGRAGRAPLFDFSLWTKAQRRSFVLFACILVLVLLFAALGTFFLTLRGAERTMVPDLRGMELPDALVQLQIRELYPRLTLKFTDNALDRNTVLDQSPIPGSIVKAGRRIQLTVSKGAVIGRVDTYVGRTLDEVKAVLAGGTATPDSPAALISLRDPPVYIFDSKPVGTVLEQKPPAGTEISGPTILELIVSKGPEVKP